MRQRAMLPDGDFSFGTGLPFLVDTPYCVAQAIMTRLRLVAGEWFLDSSEGLDYDGAILGYGRDAERDIAIRTRILETAGVVQIDSYTSFVDPATRAFVMAATVATLYGTLNIADQI